MFLTRLLNVAHHGKWHNHHPRWIARTVIVKDGRIEEAFQVLNRIMGSEGLFDIVRRKRSYEKPCKVRVRVAYTMAKAIYDEDMARKIKFVTRTNRVDPWYAMID